MPATIGESSNPVDVTDQVAEHPRQRRSSKLRELPPDWQISPDSGGIVPHTEIEHPVLRADFNFRMPDNTFRILITWSTAGSPGLILPVADSQSETARERLRDVRARLSTVSFSLEAGLSAYPA